MKKIFSLILISIFFTNIFSVQNIFAEEKKDNFPDKSIPEITKIEMVYANKEWDFFIYWKNFWKDLANIEVLVAPKNFDLWLWKWEKNQIKVRVDKIYNTMLTWKIEQEYKNWILIVKKKIWEKEFVSSNKKKVDFWLPTLKKVEAPNWFLWWKKVIFSWENFKKPIYWILWSEKIICEKDDENTCEITIPKDITISWKIWIESYWFETLLWESVSIEKTATVKVTSYSNNLINFSVKGFEFKDLIKPLKTKKDYDDFQDWKPMELNSWIKVYVDWQNLRKRTVYKTLRISCEIDKEIYQQWIWYIDFFGIKTPFFSYDLSDKTPYLRDFKNEIKWSSYQDWKWQTVEGNRIYITMWVENFEYQRSNELWQSTKNDFVLVFWWKEYKVWDRNFTLWRDKVELRLEDFPSKMQWDIYVKLWNVVGKSIPYDFWDYIPEIYKVYKWEKKDEFVIEWKNLTNFNNLDASLSFWDISLSTADIKKIMSEKEKEAKEIIKKYEDWIKLEEKEDLPDTEKINWYRNQISKWNSVLIDLQNWIYERNYKDESKTEWEIVKKSDTRIVFKVFDAGEYWKSIWKWDYTVSVTSNWQTTNKIDFFYDPEYPLNEAFAYPEIEKMYFVNWAWDPSKIEIKWKFLDRIKELYFTDLKAQITKKTKNLLLVEVDPWAILRKRWTIIAKLDDFTMTSNLLFYEFIDDKTNEISLKWKKIEKKLDKDWNPISEKIDEDKKTFELLFKNTYKDLILKNLKIKIEKLDNWDFPFYDFSLNYPWWSLKWVYDKKSKTINFKNTDFSKIIPVNTDKMYDFIITFNKINFWKWEVKISVVDLNFYDDFKFPKKISSKKISFSKTPKFYQVPDDFWKFCREINLKWEFVLCWSEIWLDNLEESDVFKEEVIKSDFRAPKKDTSKIADFVDVDKNQWFEPYVVDLFQRWIIQWYWEKSKFFKPLKTITRAEAVKILLIARSEDVSDLSYKVYAFEDVPEGHWAKNILEYAVRNKFLIPVKNFHLNREITRGEAAKLITKFFWRTVSKYSQFSLLDLWKHWSSNHAEYLFQNKIISWVWDTNEFKPENKVTRSEFAKMISLAMKYWAR